MAIQLAVIGAGDCDAQIAARAEAVGRAIARRGGVLLTGGMGGVMAAASRGAHEAGGLIVGVVPGGRRHTANEYVAVEIVTNMGHARNVILAHSADALIAVSGGYGTLSEIAVGLKMGKPVIGLGSWAIEGVVSADSPEQAVELAVSKCGG
ncbi:MAG TPA: TIGR00725 family protein [bacterium]|nr:TIGR00725 family protein [bacterium]